MLDAIKKSLRELITEPDNTTVCPVRIIGLFGTAQGLGLHAYDVLIQHAHFDLQNFGLGFGAIMAAIGVALGAKHDSAALDKK